MSEHLEIKGLVEIEIEDFVIKSLADVAALWRVLENMNLLAPKGVLPYFPLGESDG